MKELFEGKLILFEEEEGIWFLDKNYTTLLNML